MLHWLLNALLPSILGSLIASFLVLAILKWKRNVVDWSLFAKIAVITVVILLIAFTYLPPYSVVSCQWCLSRDGKTIVKGYIVNSIYRNPAPGVAIQIKLFPSGSAIPLHDRQFGSTDVNGVFSVELGPSPPEQQEMYIINTAYNYSSLFLTDRWHIKDFSRANPGQCK